jgi:hypothetical protein
MRWCVFDLVLAVLVTVVHSRACSLLVVGVRAAAHMGRFQCAITDWC